MATRGRWKVVSALILAAGIVTAVGCGDDDDDDSCLVCCKCSNLGSPVAYRPASDQCTGCKQQCQDLADHDFLGQPFDYAKEISCD